MSSGKIPVDIMCADILWSQIDANLAMLPRCGEILWDEDSRIVSRGINPICPTAGLCNVAPRALTLHDFMAITGVRR